MESTLVSEHPFALDGKDGASRLTVRHHRLPNGLDLLLVRDPAAPIFAYQTWFRVGSRHERDGITGIAHLFEHLMFNQTESHPPGEFDRLIEMAGGDTNAATWVDWTYYRDNLPSSELRLAVELEADRMAHLVLGDKQVESEREVVANERRFRVEDDVDGFLSEELFRIAFTTHPYHWPTIGWMADIEGFTPEDCVAFYKTYYAPNNATIVIVGDVRVDDVLRRLRDAYGPIPPSIIPEEDTTPEPAQLDSREVVMEKPTASDKTLLGFHGPALGDADHPALCLLNEILFGGRASRLYRELVTTREVCTEIRGWVSTFRDPGLYEMYFTSRPGVPSADVMEHVDRELGRVKEELVADDELVRAKARLELGLVQSLETMSGKAEQIGFYDTVLGDPAAAFRRLEAYRRVTAGEIRTAARRYLKLDARTMIRVVPDTKSKEAAE